MQTNNKLSNDNWTRIMEIIECYNFSSVSAFARHLGLNRGENLYQIKRGNNGISKELAEAISKAFPDVSKAWVLTGEGRMFSNLPANTIMDQIVGVPYFHNFPLNRPPSEPEKIMYYSKELVSNVDFAVSCNTDELLPLYKKDSVLFLRRWAMCHPVIYGEVYFIKTNFGDMYRIIRKARKPDEIVLESPNNAKYDEMTIRISDITELYIIV